jgi:adenylate kinase
MEDCIKKIRQNNMISNDPLAQRLKWDAFLPAVKTNGSHYILANQKGIIRRIGKDVIPAIHSMKHEVGSNPALVKMKQYSPLPSIKNNLSPKSKAWRNIIFVLGGPGSGKGTQSKKLSAEYNYAHLSVGDLLREEVAKETTFGREINILMKEGKIVPAVFFLLT